MSFWKLRKYFKILFALDLVVESSMSKSTLNLCTHKLKKENSMTGLPFRPGRNREEHTMKTKSVTYHN